MATEILYQQDELELIFRACVEHWSRDTCAVSSVTTMILHPAYQRIIGLGRQALPLLFQELRANPGHWFWALRSITGEDPTKPGDDFQHAIEGWLRWGQTHGYIE